jgi:hypothetical protein
MMPQLLSRWLRAHFQPGVFFRKPKIENLVIRQDDRTPAPVVQTNIGKSRRLKPAATNLLSGRQWFNVKTENCP